MKIINIGVLGAGRIGKIHSQNIAKFSNVCLKSIADPYLDKQWAKMQNIENLYNDVNDIINDDIIDAIYICTPSDTHASLIKQASNKGKAIFCEKPVDLDIKEILEVKKILKTNNTIFQLGFNRRFDANFIKLADMLKGGEIGKLITLKIISRDPDLPPVDYIKLSGGLFMDMSIHDFDIARFISGDEVEEISVKAGNFIKDLDGIDVDTAMMSLTLKSGAFVLIENCRKTTYGYDQRVEAFGTNANANFSNIYEDTVSCTNANGVNSSKPLDFFLERYAKAYEEETNSFIDCLVNDKKPRVGIDDGLESTILAFAAKKSLDENRNVKIDEIRKEFNIIKG